MQSSRSLPLTAVMVCCLASFTCRAADSTPSNARAECGEIAHRLACHSIHGACRKGESPSVFEDRYDLESMILSLCTKGPSEFSKDHWIDVYGAYHPYRVGADGKQIKRYPPAQR